MNRRRFIGLLAGLTGAIRVPVPIMVRVPINWCAGFYHGIWNGRFSFTITRRVLRPKGVRWVKAEPNDPNWVRIYP